MRPLALSLAASVVLLVPAAATPRAAPVVVLDPGHDALANPETEALGPDSGRRKIKDGGGAVGVVSRTPEAVIALDVALRLRRLLVRNGIRVVMTRTRTSGVSMGNIERARIANRAGAALFLRIHADGAADPTRRGTHTLHPAFRKGWTDDIYAASKTAAKLTQASLVRRLRSRDLGLDERTDITGFNWADVPSILVELGFLTNPTEDRLLNTPSYRNRAAAGLRDGVVRFLAQRR